MQKSGLLWVVCAVACARIAVADQAPTAPPSPSPQALAALHAACDADIQKLCPGVQPGGGRILACLKEHKDDVSGGCKQAVAKAMQGS
jgi:hypothetical protein